MTEFKLDARTGFGLDQQLAEEWPGFALGEIADQNIWWMSAAQKQVEALGKACEKQFGTGLPEKGRFVGTESGLRILWAGERQWFVTGILARMPPAIARLAAATDQSDGWVGVRMEGDKTRDVLERICLLDLHPAVFATGMCARTPIEGMHALIACEDAEAGKFAVHFQRSSARSFVAHVRHAAHSACPRD